jgi:hypothetical protein
MEGDPREAGLSLNTVSVPPLSSAIQSQIDLKQVMCRKASRSDAFLHIIPWSLIA